MKFLNYFLFLILMSLNLEANEPTCNGLLTYVDQLNQKSPNVIGLGKTIAREIEPDKKVLVLLTSKVTISDLQNNPQTFVNFNEFQAENTKNIFCSALVSDRYACPYKIIEGKASEIAALLTKTKENYKAKVIGKEVVFLKPVMNQYNNIINIFQDSIDRIKQNQIILFKAPGLRELSVLSGNAAKVVLRSKSLQILHFPSTELKGLTNASLMYMLSPFGKNNSHYAIAFTEGKDVQSVVVDINTLNKTTGFTHGSIIPEISVENLSNSQLKNLFNIPAPSERTVEQKDIFIPNIHAPISEWKTTDWIETIATIQEKIVSNADLSAFIYLSFRLVQANAYIFAKSKVVNPTMKSELQKKFKDKKLNALRVATHLLIDSAMSAVLESILTVEEQEIYKFLVTGYIDSLLSISNEDLVKLSDPGNDWLTVLPEEGRFLGIVMNMIQAKAEKDIKYNNVVTTVLGTLSEMLAACWQSEFTFNKLPGINIEPSEDALEIEKILYKYLPKK